MKRFVRGILHPEAFHGEGRPAPFFEGWYYKLVTADGQSLALIPGMFRGREADSDHGFLQVVRPGEPWVDYRSYPLDTFKGRDDALAVELGGHRFTSEGLRLEDDGLSGEVRFGSLASWPVTWASPGVMGWYAWVPTMQCYHGIVSLDHTLSGALEVSGERFDFEGGRGYIEKDWGRSFPKRWIWMQSNHFSTPGVCVTISLANVPWIVGAFPGFLVGVWRDGQLKRFTTYTGAKVTDAGRTEDGVRFSCEDATHRLTVRARGGRAVPLHKPSEASMRGIVHEHLDATLEVRLERRSGDIEFEDVGRGAAWEAEPTDGW
ncbi:MAG: tocopherol cyclase family protein [Myxococcota bacterium]